MAYNRNNFFKNTYCVFTQVPTTEIPTYSHYRSRSGSSYFFTDDGVYRTSNHWGRAAKCKWKLASDDNSQLRMKTGFAKWTSFYSDNDWEKLYFISANSEMTEIQFRHKEESNFTENLTLRTAAATTKRIREIRKLIKNANWLNYYNENERSDVLKNTIQTLITSEESVLAIRRQIDATL